MELKKLNSHAQKFSSYLEKFDKNYYTKTGKRLSESKLNTIGTMLENFEATAVNNPTKFLTEDIQSLDVSFVKQYGLDIIYKTIVNQLADEIASVQPIQARDARIRYMEIYYDKTATETEKHMTDPFINGLGQNGSGITGGGSTSTSLDSSGKLAITITANLLTGHLIITNSDGDKFIDFGGKLYKAGVSSSDYYGLVNYTTGAITTDATSKPLGGASSKVLIQYSTDNVTTPVVNAKKASMRIQAMPIRAKSVKIITVYSVEAIQELQIQYGIGIHTEFVDQVVNEVIATIDYDLMDVAKRAADMSLSVVNWKISLDPLSVNAITYTQHYQDFALKISEAANLVYAKTRQIRPNILIIGAGLAPVIEALPQFAVANGTFSGSSTQGAYVLGNLGAMKVIVNPNYEPHDCILIYKDNKNPLLASLIYAPYLPVSKVFSTSAERFENQIGLFTSYGIAVPTPHWFAKVNILP